MKRGCPSFLFFASAKNNSIFPPETSTHKTKKKRAGQGGTTEGVSCADFQRRGRQRKARRRRSLLRQAAFRGATQYGTFFQSFRGTPLKRGAPSFLFFASAKNNSNPPETSTHKAKKKAPDKVGRASKAKRSFLCQAAFQGATQYGTFFQSFTKCSFYIFCKSAKPIKKQKRR